jgi:16S rRNA G527 N7-methylase RsmG
MFLRAVARALGLPLLVNWGRAEDFASWQDTEVVTFRAFRPSRRLQASLAAHNLSLLQFAGKQSKPLEKPWEVVCQQRFPLSQRRLLTHYRNQLFHVKH